MNTQTATTCAYCGDSEALSTRDHVIPKAFWKDTTMPPNPLTISACRPCQNHWDAETTYFRNMLVMQSDMDDHPAIKRILDGPIKRRINTSKPDLKDLTRNATVAWKQTISGIYNERGVRIEIDLARFQRTPEKIIRGLFYLRNGIVLPPDYVARIVPENSFWNDAGFNNLLATMHDWQGCGDDVFQMRAVRDDSDGNFTAWLLMFFKSSAIFGYTCPKTYAESAA